MKKTVLGMFITTALAIACVSCVTQVPISRVRHPTIDTSGIQRLGIAPFKNGSGIGGPVTAQLVRYLTDKAASAITGTGKFTVVAASDPNADGVFRGELTVITSKDSRESLQGKDKDGNPVTIITYKRDVSVEFSYSIVSSRTDMPLGTVVKTGTASSASTESPGKLEDTLTLAKSIVDSEMNGLDRDIVPYIVSESRSLVKETSKDKVLKDRMKAVLKLVNSGNYEEAIRQYDGIAGEYGNAAARANAGILRESIASRNAAASQLAELLNSKDGLAEKAVKTMAAGLKAKLPPGAAISIIKTGSREPEMIEYVVDQLTKTLVQAGTVTVVDRSNRSLIGAEQRFQTSGYVSDESAVSLGKQLGVKYMVLCWISGEKSLRRLTTKVLNVETARIEYQNDVEI
jgi:hypothetical protein